MKKQLLLAVLLALFLSGIVSATDKEPTGFDADAGCTTYNMCKAQTAVGDCTDLPASGATRVKRVAGKSHLSFYSTQSTATNYSCDIFSNDVGHDLLSGVGHQINTASLTQLSPILTFDGQFRFVWVTCPTLDDNQVTITLEVCAANR